MSEIGIDSPRHVLLSGATGFLGSELCGYLRKRGVRVRGVVRSAVDGPWDDMIVADLASSGIEKESLYGIDTVFHLAGKAHALSETRDASSEYARINTEGTRRLLSAARVAGVRRFVFFSSVKAVGEGGVDCMDESSNLPAETPYGQSKREAERLVIEGGYVPSPVVLRLSMVYGPSDKGNLPRMIESVAKGRFPPLPESSNRRSMVHVEDVVQAAVLAAERLEAVGQIYNVTDGQTYSSRQIYEWICDALGRPVPRWNVPMGVLKALASVGDRIGRMRDRRFIFDSDVLDKLVGSACYSSDKIVRELGFRPKRNLRSSLPEIIAYLDLS